MKVLFVATVRSHIGHFHMPFIKHLKELGCTVDAAFKDNSKEKPGFDLSDIDSIYEISFSRSPYSLKNVKAYFQLKKLIIENDYDAVHCHTPMGAVVTRLAAHSLRKNGLKVIYTAHGFHFYKGAPKKNFLFYYPVEKYLSRFTDCLITINNEDYLLAKEQFSAKKVCKVNGVGVDTSRFCCVNEENKAELRKQYGYSNDCFIMIYPANLNYEKNHIMLFNVVKRLKEMGVNIKLLCPGKQDLLNEFETKCSDMDIKDNVDFLGFRHDIDSLVGLSDISVSSSLREGLPVNLIEAMACGNPIVATDVRGNNDLIEDGVNGFLVKVGDCDAMADRVYLLFKDKELFNRFSEKNYERCVDYSNESVIASLEKIYKDCGVL